jgi:enoyl-CoA hydratase/carnithine racemase
MSELLLEKRAFDAREAKEKRLIQHIADGNPAAARMIAQRSAQSCGTGAQHEKTIGAASVNRARIRARTGIARCFHISGIKRLA